MAGIRLTPNSNVQTATINYPSQVTGSTPQLQIINSPGGGKGQVQFHAGNGSFSGDSNFTWNAKTRTMSILGNIRISESIIGRYNTNTKNLKITGGEDGYVLSTDGTGNISWIPAIVYGNTNVANYLPTYTGNLASLTGVVTTTANITANYIIGNGSQLTGLPTSYSNTNVAAYLPTYTGNLNGSNIIISDTGYIYNISSTGLSSLTTVNVSSNLTTNAIYTDNYFYANGNAIPLGGGGNTLLANLDANGFNIGDAGNITANYFIGDGSQLTNLSAPTVTFDDTSNGYMDVMLYDGNIKYTASVTIEPSSGNINTIGNITANNLGNISNINLDGSNSNMLYGNGVFAPASSGNATLPIANGTSNIDIATSDGNITITANSTNTWTFGEDGLLTLPSGNVVIGSLLGADAILATNTPFGVVSQGNGSAVLQWMDDISNTTALSAIYINGPTANIGDIVVTTGEIGVGVANVWNFTASGNLNLASGNSVIQSVANNAGDGSGLSTLNLYPDNSTVDDRYLIVDPTGPNHIHIRAGGNIDNSNVMLIIGGETSGFRVDAGLDPNVYITANSLLWTFSNSGTLTLPGGGIIDGSDFDVDIIAGNDGSSTYGHISFTANGPIGMNSLTFNSLGELTVSTADANDGLIKWVGNSSGDGGGYTTMVMVPDTTTEGNDQYLIIDPTGPGHIHIRAGGTQDNSNADLFLGGENSHFRVENGLNPNVYISANNQAWIFGNDGSLTFPTGGNLIFDSNATSVIDGVTNISVSGNLTVDNTLVNRVYLLETYANVIYTLPGSFTEDVCRYSVVSANVNVPSAWFDTSTYTFTPQKAGYWEITASYDIYRNTEASMAIKKNGSSVAATGSFNAVAQQIRKIIYLNGSTDYINIINVGGAALQRAQFDSRSWFQARWVGA